MSSKSPIATPPRVALTGRSTRTDHHPDAPPPTGSSSTSSPDPPAATPDTKAPSLTREHVENGTSTGTGSSTTHDHDDDKAGRIARLEIEMAMMEEEFSREFQLLGDKLSNESEMSAFWQQKHSALHQQFLKADTDLRVLRHEVAAGERQREERERDVKTRISSLLLDRDTVREGYHALKMEGKQKEEEIARLRAQVKGLKDFVSTNSKMDGQVTDEVFGERMQKLGNELQNWVIQNFRKAKIDSSLATENTREELLRLVPTYETLAVTAKLHMIQSLISRILISSIFDHYFVGLAEAQARELHNIEQYLLSSTNDIGKVNQWRSTTLSILRSGAPDHLQPTKEALITSLVEKINMILSSVSNTTPNPTRDTSLRILFTTSIDLSQLLRVQKAVFKTIMPVIEGHQINTFDAEVMEDIGGEDEDSLEGREISCVVFLGLVKEGDESGEQTQLRNVIAKARVLCVPD